MKTNYHTHNLRCKHATGDVLDYVKMAIEEGYEEIGISDHMPHPGLGIDDKSRMFYDELSSYFSEIDSVKKIMEDKIKIKKGLECEYFEELKWIYKELKEEYKVDYLILGAHFFKHKGNWVYVGWELDHSMLEEYINHVIKSMETGLFKYLAHPDLFFMIYKEWDEYSIKASRRILEAAERLNMPLEININGMKKAKLKCKDGERYPYPHKEFWKLSKEYKVKRIIGVDAHNPKDLKDYKEGLDFAKELGLEIIDRLEF